MQILVWNSVNLTCIWLTSTFIWLSFKLIPWKIIVIFEIMKKSFSPKNLSSCLVFFFWLLDSSFIIIFRANPLRKSFRMTGRRHRSRISAKASASLRRWNIEPSSSLRISIYVQHCYHNFTVVVIGVSSCTDGALWFTYTGFIADEHA